MQKIYFLGIGGIGMSAIARYYQQRGVEIHGYDRVRTTLTEQLEKEGMHIHYTDDVSLIPQNIDLVVYTPAIPATHGELQYFRAHNYDIKKRAEVLGLISKNQRCLAVGGTHGKTTTSAILTHLLRTSGIDCSAFLGGISLSLGSNFVAGTSEFVVVEADEFDRSFLHLHPEVAIITSTDADHLDIYGDEATIQDTYRQFAAQTRQTLIHKAGLPLFADTQGAPNHLQAANIYSYDTSDDTHADVVARNIRIENGYFFFDYENTRTNTHFKNLQFSQYGRHNIENATAAITAALTVGAQEAGIRIGLRTFGGIKRRFEFIIRNPNLVYIDDYAHHPRELTAAIEAARALHPDQYLIGIFQPHLFSRTRDFVDGFAAALDLLDEVILLDIYPARELPIEGVSSKIIFDKMKNKNRSLLEKSELLDYLRQRPVPKILLTLGAGDIGAMVEDIADLLLHPVPPASPQYTGDKA
jgi:UDP-N-acetylmuramate--alanine ligase